MDKVRLDVSMMARKLVGTRSQAESYIKLGKVKVNGVVITKAGHFIKLTDKITLAQKEQYVSRAGLKLASAAETLKLDFKDKAVLDVGSSTGGFTDYALKHGATKVIAVEVGTDQMHPGLRGDKRIELHEKTDVRNLKINEKIDIVLIDVSFISIRDILPTIAKLSNSGTQIIAMLKPQFEAGKQEINRGVVKNDTLRRRILKDFENWAKGTFLVESKADSEVAGARGNRERFYLLRKMS